MRFDREGVSYIFCNIHPEMGAIVLALNTPYYGISERKWRRRPSQRSGGKLSAECMEREWSTCEPGCVTEIVQVSTDAVHLGDITLQATTDALAHHKNKFGEDYEPSRDQKY